MPHKVTINMEALMVCCVLVLLPYCAFGDGSVESDRVLPSQDETFERLIKIEALLETVIEKNNQLERKNGELEKRIEALEGENQRLNALVSKQEEQNTPSDHADDDTTDTAVYIESEASPALPSGKTNILNLREMANRAPRLLLSADKTVAFTASISNYQGLTGLGIGQTIVYEHVITNVGGAYHNTTGIFTVPVSGVYVFNLDTMIDTGNSQYLSLVVDGTTLLTSFTHGAQETHVMTSSRTVTLRVGVGSEVWVRTASFVGHGNGTIHGRGYSSFSGWLLNLTE